MAQKWLGMIKAGVGFDQIAVLENAFKKRIQTITDAKWCPKNRCLKNAQMSTPGVVSIGTHTGDVVIDSWPLTQ